MTKRRLGLALRCIGIAVAVGVAIFDLTITQMLVVAFGVGLAQIGVVMQYHEANDDPRI